MHEKFVGHLAQPPGQLAGQFLGIGADIFPVDRAHRIDMLVDQRQRDVGQIGRMLDKPAQTIGGAG